MPRLCSAAYWSRAADCSAPSTSTSPSLSTTWPTRSWPRDNSTKPSARSTRPARSTRSPTAARTWSTPGCSRISVWRSADSAATTTRNARTAPRSTSSAAQPTTRRARWRSRGMVSAKCGSHADGCRTPSARSDRCSASDGRPPSPQGTELPSQASCWRRLCVNRGPATRAVCWPVGQDERRSRTRAVPSAARSAVGYFSVPVGSFHAPVFWSSLWQCVQSPW